MQEDPPPRLRALRSGVPGVVFAAAWISSLSQVYRETYSVEDDHNDSCHVESPPTDFEAISSSLT